MVALAAAHDVMVVPHGSSVYSYHLQYAFPNCPLAEFINMSPKADAIVPYFGEWGGLWRCEGGGEPERLREGEETGEHGSLPWAEADAIVPHFGDFVQCGVVKRWGRGDQRETWGIGRDMMGGRGSKTSMEACPGPKKTPQNRSLVHSQSSQEHETKSVLVK